MGERKYRIDIEIGAAVNKRFDSATEGSARKIRQIGVAIKDVNRQSASTTSAVGKMTRQTDRLLTSLNGGKQLFATPDYYRTEIMALIGLAMAFTVPIKAAMEFQDALAGIKSVVNFPSADGLEKLGDQLSDLSREIPVTANELASISAIGGRFGVPLKELTTFSKEVGKTAIAWGASINDTAERVGNLMKVFKASTSELPKYFDAINELGNKTGATADQILQAVNRSSDGLANFKLSIPQVAALTSTIISFGEGAEQAGSAVSTMLQKLSIAPQLGKEAHKALHRMGISAVALPKMIQDDPQKALDALLTGLSKLDPENRSSAMYNIFGRGASKAVGKLVDNLQLYRKNLSYISDEKLFKGSRDTDYDIVFDTLRSKIKLLTSTISALMRAVGFSLAPLLTKIVTAITNFLTPVVEWTKENKELLSYFTTVAVKLTALRLSLLSLRFVASSLFGTMNQAGKAFAFVRWGISLASFALQMFFFGWFGKSLVIGAAIYSYFGGLSTITGGVLAANIGKLSSKFKVFATLLKIKLTPLLKFLWKEVLEIGAVFGSVLRPEIRALITLTKNLAIALARQMKPIWAYIKKFGGTGVKLILKGITSIFKNSGNTAKRTKKLILPTIAALGLFKGAFWIFGRFGKGLIKSFFGGFHNVLKGSLILLRTFLTVTWRIGSIVLPVFFRGLYLLSQLFWFFVSEVIPVVLNGIWGLARGLVTLVTDIIPATVAIVRRMSASFMIMARTALAPVIASVTKFAKAVRMLVVSGFMKLEKACPLVALALRGILITSGILAIAGAAYLVIKNWEKIKRFFIITGLMIKAVWQGVSEGFSDLWKIFRTLGRLLWHAIKFSYHLGIVLLAVGENFNALVERFIFGKNVAIPAWEKVKELFANFWNDITKEWDDFLEKIKKLSFTDAIITAWNSVKNIFSSLWNGEKVDTVINKTKKTDEITSAWAEVKKTFASLWNDKEWNKFFEQIKKLEITHEITSAWKEVKKTFESLWKGSEWEQLFEQMKKLEITDGIVAAWEQVKKTFENLFKDILPSWNSITDEIESIFGNKQTMALKTVPANNAITPTNRPEINARNAAGNKNQKNNTTVNITQNIGSGDPTPIARETARAVTKAVSGTPLYDLAVI